MAQGRVNALYYRQLFDKQSIQNANVWTHTRMVNEQGADDYFERAASRPDLLLADLIKITHPDLLNDHQIEWYKRLPE